MVFERSLMADLLGVYNEICAEMMCQMSELLLDFTYKQGSKWGMSVSHTRDLMNGLGTFCAEKEASLVLSPVITWATFFDNSPMTQ